MLTIRNANLREMAFFMEVAHKEGWDPGLYDGAAFFQTDPDGFFLAELDGGLAGGVSAVSYGGRQAFIGSHFVLPPYRRRGIGKTLWEKALAAAGEQEVSLCGLPEGRDFYEAYGFRAVCNVIRYGGRIFRQASLDGEVRAAQDMDFSRLAAFDARCFGRPRELFLKNWLDTPALESICVLDAADRERILGWGAMRRSRQGWRIGPVFAERPAVAERILRRLAAKTIGEPVSMDVSDSNAQAIRLAFALGMTPKGARLRLTRGQDQPEPLEQIYAFSTVDIG